MTRLFFLLGTALILSTAAFADSVIIDKTPDRGGYWNPLSGGSSYLYANSFVAPSSTTANTLGIYLQNDRGPGSRVRFELWADNGNSPQGGTVLGVTDYHQYSDTTLSLRTAQMLTSVSLVAGTRYWVVGSTVGQPDQGSYRAGAHSPGADGGRFWFSNDPAGLAFDGGGFPEMAIYVAYTTSAVPEPSAFTALALPLAAGLLLRKRNNR